MRKTSVVCVLVVGRELSTMREGPLCIVRTYLLLAGERLSKSNLLSCAKNKHETKSVGAACVAGQQQGALSLASRGMTIPGRDALDKRQPRDCVWPATRLRQKFPTTIGGRSGHRPCTGRPQQYIHQKLTGEGFRLRPARVHLVEHASPVVALSATGPGLKLQVAVRGGQLSPKREQGLCSGALCLLPESSHLQTDPFPPAGDRQNVVFSNGKIYHTFSQTSEMFLQQQNNKSPCVMWID